MSLFSNRANQLLSIIIICIVFLVVLVWQLESKKYSKAIEYIENGETFEKKVFGSPSNKYQLTVLLHTTGGLDYSSYLYIVNGEYSKDELPISLNHIKFPDSTGIYIDWQEDGKCILYTDHKPLVQTLNSERYKIDIIVNRNKIDSLLKEGYKVIRYSTHEK